MKEKTTKVAALGAIAKELKKIAKEMKRANKRANEPLEEVFELTEKGKALVEQHKDECEELSNTPSNEDARAAVKTLNDYCKLQQDNKNCRSCLFFTKEKCLINDLPAIEDLPLVCVTPPPLEVLSNQQLLYERAIKCEKKESCKGAGVHCLQCKSYVEKVLL